MTICRSEPIKYLKAHWKANALPKYSDRMAQRDFALYFALQICRIPDPSITNQERVRCFQGADQGLSGENEGNHPECSNRHMMAAAHLVYYQENFERELSCYSQAFSRDYDKIQTMVNEKVPYQTDKEYFRKFATRICRQSEGLPPSKAMTEIPESWALLFATPHSDCQKIEERWAQTALKEKDGELPLPRSDHEKVYLIYELAQTLCEDPGQAEKFPDFERRCFYSSDLNGWGLNMESGVYYGNCLLPDLVPSNDDPLYTPNHETKADAQKRIDSLEAQRSMALSEASRGKSKSDSLKCYLENLAKDFKEVQEQRNLLDEPSEDPN